MSRDEQRDHARYEALAVGHVLGGLQAADADGFRTHLLACPACRTRVAELRGIAADLAAAERDERSRSSLRTELPRRSDESHAVDDTTPSRHRRWAAVLLVMACVGLLLGLSFWNLHLRSSTSAYLGVANERGEALTVLAQGEPVDVQLAGVAEGQAAIDGEVVALTVAGLGPLDDSTWLVAWLFARAQPEQPVAAVTLAGPGQMTDGTLAAVLEHRDADRVAITRESQGSTPEPSGPEVVSIELRGGGED